MNPECPKCGKRMTGPSYHVSWVECGGRAHDKTNREHLHYHCTCGYDTTRPTRDAKAPRKYDCNHPYIPDPKRGGACAGDRGQGCDHPPGCHPPAAPAPLDPSEAEIDAALEAAPVWWDVHPIPPGHEIEAALPTILQARAAVAKMLRAANAARGRAGSAEPPSKEQLAFWMLGTEAGRHLRAEIRAEAVQAEHFRVHNHGPEDGPGLACNERLVGECLLGQAERPRAPDTRLLDIADEIIADYYDYIDNAGPRARELVKQYRGLRYYGRVDALQGAPNEP